MVLEKTLESPLDSKEIKPVNPEGISLEGLMLKLKFQCFGHQIQRTDAFELLEKILESPLNSKEINPQGNQL